VLEYNSFIVGFTKTPTNYIFAFI